MIIRRLLVPAVAATGVVLLAAPSASAVPPDVTTFSDPLGGSFSCEGFDATYSGHDRGRITNLFDSQGVLVRQVGHIHAVETDTNLSTGESVVIRTNITVHANLAPDGTFLTYAITGQFNVGTDPGEGIVLHDTGRVAFNEQGEPTLFRGVHDTFVKGEQAFCDALS